MEVYFNGEFMIFVTVGTHEQPFDRLIKCIDRIAEEKIVSDMIVVQRGFSCYIPRFCDYSDFFSYRDMIRNVENARIVITHGGPSSFMEALERNKIPIVVPRLKKFKEHINDHQADFVRNYSARYKNIIPAESDREIRQSILHYDDIIKNMPKLFISNNEKFTQGIERLAMELVK